MSSANPTRVLIFLGAGVSTQFGVLLARELVGGFLSSSIDESHKSRIRTLRNLLRTFSVDDSLENLLTILDFSSNPSKMMDRMGPILPLIAGSPQVVNLGANQEDGAIAKELRDFVFRKCFIDDADAIKKVDSFYHSFLSGIASYFKSATIESTPYARAPIFTTNFDNSVELFATRNGIAIFDGYDRLPTGAYAFNHKLYDTEFNKNSIRLYKIHGTVRYVRNPRGEFDELTILPPSPDIRIHGGICTPELIYSESYQYTLSSPWLELMYCMREELISADRIIALGYSFPDPHILTVVREVLEGRKWQGRLVICNRHPRNVIDSRFRDLAGKCVAVPADSASLVVPDEFSANGVPS